MKKKACVLCGGTVGSGYGGLFDTRFGIEGDFSVGRCSTCGVGQLSPMPSASALSALYGDHYNFRGETNRRYTRWRERFFSSVAYRFWMAVDGDISFHGRKGTGRLLDVGCNEGRGLAIYRRNGYDVQGLEVNARAAEAARKKGFVVHTESLADYRPKAPFDVVVLSNVLEHALQPGRMLAHVHRILKPEGCVWISCPNMQSWIRKLLGRFWINWHVPFHIVHFTPATLAGTLHRAGFQVVRVTQTTPALWVAHSVLAKCFARKGSVTRKLRDPLFVGGLMVAIRFLCAPFLWLGNRLGRGDCLVLVALKNE